MTASPFSLRSKIRRVRTNRHRSFGRWPRAACEVLEPRLLLAADAMYPGASPPAVADPVSGFRVGFRDHDLSLQEGAGQVNLAIELHTPDGRPLPSDVVVSLVSDRPEALQDNLYYRWLDLPQVRFPAGTLSDVRFVSLIPTDDAVVRGSTQVQFDLHVESDNLAGPVFESPVSRLDVSLRGNDEIDVVLNGRAPALVGSKGSLRLLLNELQDTAKVQWASHDLLHGQVYTEARPADSFAFQVGNLNEPGRFDFTFVNSNVTHVGDVLLSDLYRGVVDVTEGARRARYLVDRDVLLPCVAPTHADLELFAKGVAYDETLQVGDQIVGYGYQVDRIFDDLITGFDALGLTCGSEAPPVLAVRGTEPVADLALDVLDDLNPMGIGYDQFTANFPAVRDWLNAIRAATTRVPSITGHSLGGALTQLLAAAYLKEAPSRRLRDVITFSSPGIRSANADSFRSARIEGAVHHYVTSGDWIAIAGEKYIPGGYTMTEFVYNNLADLRNLDPLKKHSNPVLVNIVGPHRKPVTVNKTYGNVNWLSSPFFCYATVDHYAVIGTASLLFSGVGTLFSHPEFGSLPLVLVFRGTTEASRQVIGFYANGVRLVMQHINPIIAEYQRTGMFEAKLPNVVLKDPFLNLLEVSATDLKVRASSIGPYRVMIQGIGRLKAILGVTANFAGNNFIGIGDSGLTLVGTIAVDTITLVPPDLWQITDMVLSINTVARRVDATATVVYGPEVSFSLPLLGSFSGRVLRQSIHGTLTPQFLRGTGQVDVLGGVASTTGTLTLDLRRPRSVAVAATFDLFGNTISTTAVAKGDTNLNLSIGGQGTVRIPSGIRVIGGKTLQSGNGLLEYFSNNNRVCVSGWGPIPGLSLVYTVNAGFRICSNGSVRVLGILGGPPIPSLPAPNPGVPTWATEDSAMAQFDVPDGLPAAAFNFVWENEGSPPVLVMDPSGTIYDEAAIYADPNLEIVNDLSSSRNKLLVVAHPTPGIWTAIVPDIASLGQVTFEANGASAVPSIDITSPVLDTSDTPAQIDFSAADPDSEATVSLYYDADRAGYDGILIAEGLQEKDAVSSFLWDTTSVPPGEYYLYARVEDDVNPPEFSRYSVGRVLVTRSLGPPQVPSLSAVWTGADTVMLQWQAVDNAAYYTVRYTVDAAGEAYELEANTPGPAGELVLTGLMPGETYRFQVAAVDGDSNPGPTSPPAVAVVGAFPTVPPGGSEWEVFADPGTTYQARFDWTSGDAATLLVAPAGSQLDMAGNFAWDVPLTQTGFSHVVVRVDRADGSIDVERRLVLSLPDRTGQIAGQVFSDLDGDGIHDSMEPGLNGFSIELLDPLTGDLLDTIVTHDRNPGGMNDPAVDVGIYQFSGLAPGNYRVRVVPQVGYDATEPEEDEALAVTVSGGGDAVAVFGQHDIALPAVSNAMYLPGDGMGAVSRLQLTFSEDVSASLQVADLSILDVVRMSYVDVTLMELTYDSLTNTATWRFPGLPGGILPGSTYLATLAGVSISDASGNLLDGDGDFQPGGDFVLGFQQSRSGGAPTVQSDTFVSVVRSRQSNHAVRDSVFARLFAPGMRERE